MPPVACSGCGSDGWQMLFMVADDPARALVAQPDQSADVADAGHLADPPGC